jgi:hypothetical protein
MVSQGAWNSAKPIASGDGAERAVALAAAGD